MKIVEAIHIEKNVTDIISLPCVESVYKSYERIGGEVKIEFRYRLSLLHTNIQHANAPRFDVTDGWLCKMDNTEWWWMGEAEYQAFCQQSAKE